MRVCAQPCRFALVASSRALSRFAWRCDLGATSDRPVLPAPCDAAEAHRAAAH